MDDKDEDPLDLKKLSLSYDFLVFKIQDHLANLTERTYECIISKKDFVYDDYLGKQLGLQSKIKEVEDLLNECSKIESEFKKIEQLETFVEDFKTRLDILERRFLSLEET